MPCIAYREIKFEILVIFGCPPLTETATPYDFVQHETGNGRHGCPTLLLWLLLLLAS